MASWVVRDRLGRYVQTEGGWAAWQPGAARFTRHVAITIASALRRSLGARIVRLRPMDEPPYFWKVVDAAMKYGERCTRGKPCEGMLK